MIRAWRIDKASRSFADAFSGEGARLVPGRWNEAGRPVVYAAGTLSLAALEKFVHMGEEGLGIRFVSYAVEIPASTAVERWSLADMPADWRRHPSPASTRAKGDAWLAARKSAVLLVPSVVVPSEQNVLLNPAHPGFEELKIGKPAAFDLDPRLWK